MEYKEQSGADSNYEASIISRAANTVFVPLRALVSIRAQRACLGTFLFVGTSIVLLGVASVAYWIFYFNYVPQVGLERIVHLQFNDGYPWGVADLGSGLASLQPYDVSVTLQLPRTPSNLAMGNFMVDLSLLSPHSSSGSDTSISSLARSRRPAILTYCSPLVDLAHKFTSMPLYAVGWKKEEEIIRVNMMESVKFARGWRNVPGSLRLEIHSKDHIQVYNAVVAFRAKFMGLRWIMYNWKISSFFIFVTLFWSVSMVCMGISWWFLSMYFKSKAPQGGPIKGNIEDDSDDVDSAEDLDDPHTTPSLSDSQPEFPTLSGKVRRKHFGSVKEEDEELIKQEEMEASINISPLIVEADDEADEVDGAKAGGTTTDSGIGTSFERSSRGIQRRRSRQFSDYNKETSD